MVGEFIIPWGIVVSSRRENGLFTQPYFAHIDTCGNATKAFRLPLRSPADFDEMFYSFNVPEFIAEPIRLNVRELEKKIERKDLKKLTFD